jgi:solute carrier family 25 oxoglutarate transporter 11
MYQIKKKSVTDRQEDRMIQQLHQQQQQLTTTTTIPIPPLIAPPKIIALNPSQQFLFGGLSGMLAICAVHPMDIIKTRMQLSQQRNTNSLQTFLNLIKNEGPLSIYTGLSASLLRQGTYTTTKLGVYWELEHRLTTINEDGKAVPPSFFVKTLSGMIAGGVAAIVGTPAEVSLIRMTADGRLPVEQRRNYKNVFDALLRIYREEGLLTMWKGCSPTVGRAVVLNAAQLAVYSEAKQMILAKTTMQDGIPVHLISSMTAGFAASFVSLPLDMAKTALQAQGNQPGEMQYKSTIDVLAKTVQRDGVLRLWRGFTPYYLKVGPHTVLTFMIFEQFKRMFGHERSH